MKETFRKLLFHICAPLWFFTSLKDTVFLRPLPCCSGNPSAIPSPVRSFSSVGNNAKNCVGVYLVFNSSFLQTILSPSHITI
ncbi:hypothetical protein CW304_03370 [Bacillus sp. UFRGS-B20]|nr:hypothetical protein CW304_03370 [Bacillus sp. UFRGS-B20]